MQQLDAWHLLTAFGDFDAIPDQHQPAVESHRIREQPLHRPGPQNRELIKLDRTAMKVLAQWVIKLRPQIQCSYDGRQADPIAPSCRPQPSRTT